MLKKVLTVFFAAAVAAMFVGCSSMQTAAKSDFNGQKVVTSGTPIEHVSVTTHGLYFLWFPLITGSTENWSMPCLCQDTVSVKAVTGAVTAQAKKAGGSGVIDLVSNNGSAGLLFYYKHASASATVVK